MNGHTDSPMFSRVRPESDSTVELRINIPRDLMCLLDACALSRGSDRTKTVIQWVTERALAQSHEAIVLERMVRGNPMLSESLGGRSE